MPCQMKALGNQMNELGNTFADDGVCAVSAVNLEQAGIAIGNMFRRPGGPQDWGRSHHSLCDLAKSGAIAATRKKLIDPNNPRKRIRQPPVVIRLDDQHLITTNPTQKYLGVIIDSELRFKEQAAYAIGKGTKWANQVQRIAKTSKGIKGGLARRLYYGVAVASTLYAVDVWGAPSFNRKDSKKTSSGLVRKLDTIQRRAAIQATGALRTTRSDLLFAHADMAPMKWLLNSHCQRAAVRMATLDTRHPLYRTIHKAARSYPRRHAAPLHDILHHSKIKPFGLETIDRRPRHPNWRPPLHTEIAQSSDDAVKADRECDADVKIYTDGSGKDGKIGASAVLYFGFRVPLTARFHLGSIKQHTVYEGECVGQLLGLKLLSNSGINLNRSAVSIGVDNQAAIKRHENRSRSSASYTVEEIHELVSSLKTTYPIVSFVLRWTQGHSGILGNEAADLEAKKAAESPNNNRRCHFGILTTPLPISRSAHRFRLAELAKRLYFRDFQKSPRALKIRRFDPSIPSSKFHKLTAT